MINTLFEITAKGGCLLLGVGFTADGLIEQPVIGPNTNFMYNQLGDCTAPQERAEIDTILTEYKKQSLLLPLFKM